MDYRDRKSEAIDAILANPVYSKDSGLIRQLKRSMMNLSVNALYNLKMVCEMKWEPTERVNPAAITAIHEEEDYYRDG